MLAVSREDFREYGLNPRYFVPEVSIHLLAPAEHIRLCQLMGTKYQKVRGFVLPSVGGDEKRVVNGEIENLSGERRIALPFDHQTADRAHELAHDILLSGAISREDREGFFRLAMSEVRRVLNDKRCYLEAEFVRKVAVNSNLQSQLTVIKHLLTFDHLTYEQRLLACELFAYAVEAKVTGNPIAGKVPVYIDMDLTRMGIKA
jgi:hypothetical protein